MSKIVKRSERLNTAVSPLEVKAIKAMARHHHITVSELVRRLIQTEAKTVGVWPDPPEVLTLEQT